jgi:hypothetical protein
MSDQQRLPAHQEAFQRSQAFALQLMRDIPELEAVAILPSWTVQQDRLPAGLMVGADGPLKHPGEMMRMALLLHRAMHEHLDGLLQIIGDIDQHAAELSQLITTRRQELNELEQQLLVTRAQPEPADGHTPPRPDFGRAGG